MKKLFLLISLIAALAANQVQAASTSLTVTAGVMTNFSLLINNQQVKITQVVLTSQGTNQAQVQLVDTFTNWLGYTNAAYSNTLIYVTNLVSTWTNYYGVTNNVTNSGSLVEITNNLVAATTNAFPIRASLATPTNSSTTLNSLGLYFINGCWVTNSGSGSAVVTITYQQ